MLRIGQGTQNLVGHGVVGVNCRLADRMLSGHCCGTLIGTECRLIVARHGRMQCGVLHHPLLLVMGVVYWALCHSFKVMLVGGGPVSMCVVVVVWTRFGPTRWDESSAGSGCVLADPASAKVKP